MIFHKFFLSLAHTHLAQTAIYPQAAIYHRAAAPYTFIKIKPIIIARWNSFTDAYRFHALYNLVIYKCCKVVNLHHILVVNNEKKNVQSG